MALEDTFAGDLASIRSTMQAALEFIKEMAAGRAWDDGLTGILDPVWRADTLTTLERKISTLNAWVDASGQFIGTRPTVQEFASIDDFIEHWRADELTNKRFRYWCYNSPLEPPVRGKGQDDRPVFIPASTDAASGAGIPNINPTTEHEEQTPQS